MIFISSFFQVENIMHTQFFWMRSDGIDGVHRFNTKKRENIFGFEVRIDLVYWSIKSKKWRWKVVYAMRK